jgi:hypothetical protein
VVEVEVTDEFMAWWDGLTEAQQERLAMAVTRLAVDGVALGEPHSKPILTSMYAMRELRVAVFGRPFRVLYVFDPRRMAVLLIGGDKTGDARWYDTMVPLADRIYTTLLQELRAAGLIPS